MIKYPSMVHHYRQLGWAASNASLKTPQHHQHSYPKRNKTPDRLCENARKSQGAEACKEGICGLAADARTQRCGLINHSAADEKDSLGCDHRAIFT
jgi:hypothetical protein